MNRMRKSILKEMDEVLTLILEDKSLMNTCKSPEELISEVHRRMTLKVGQSLSDMPGVDEKLTSMRDKNLFNLFEGRDSNSDFNQVGGGGTSKSVDSLKPLIFKITGSSIDKPRLLPNIQTIANTGRGPKWMYVKNADILHNALSYCLNAHNPRESLNKAIYQTAQLAGEANIPLTKGDWPCGMNDVTLSHIIPGISTPIPRPLTYHSGFTLSILTNSRLATGVVEMRGWDN